MSINRIVTSTGMEVPAGSEILAGDRLRYLLRFLNCCTASGMKIAMITSGQMMAPAIAWPSIQKFDWNISTPGVWNNSRMALAVDDTGFQAAIAPSQSGIMSGGAKTEEINPSGNATATRFPAASVFLISSPK